MLCKLFDSKDEIQADHLLGEAGKIWGRGGFKLRVMLWFSGWVMGSEVHQDPCLECTFSSFLPELSPLMEMNGGGRDICYLGCALSWELLPAFPCSQCFPQPELISQ